MTVGLLRRNSFEAGTSGATATTSNTGGPADDAFNNVAVVGTGTGTFTTAQALVGSQSLRIQTPSATDVFRLDFNGQNDTSGSFRFAFRLNSLPTAQPTLMRLVDGSAALICAVVLTTTNKIQLQDKLSAAVKTFTTTLVTGQWYRVEGYAIPGTTTSNGTLAISYFLDNSTSPAETGYSSNAQNAGTLHIAEARFGKVTGSGTFDGWIDEVAYLPNGTALLGPPPDLIVVPAPRAAASGALVLPTVSGQITVQGTGPARAVAAMPTPTITGVAVPDFVATPEPGNSPPRVRLEINNVAGPSVMVTRTTPDGISTPVRGGDPALTTAGAFLVLYDYEAPYNQSLTYTAGSVQTSPVLLSVHQPWLVHPGLPSLSQSLHVVSLGDETMASTAGIHEVVGRQHPIIVSDGRRKGATFSLALKTFAVADRSALGQLFQDTEPLLLQIVDPDYTAEYDYRWVSIGNIVMSRLSSTNYTLATRIWSCDCTDTDAPVGSIQAQRTWADLIAECRTWADVTALYKTWRGALTGIAGE